MLSRLRAVLPTRWFPDSAPVLDGLLSGLATAWQWSHDLLQYVQMQTRIATATDIWLDIIARDFFGTRLVRAARPGRSCVPQSHPARAVSRTRDTWCDRRYTGRSHRPDAAVVFEPARITDTGGYGSLSGGGGAVGYGVAGGWGSLDLPFQCFVTAFRPLGSGIATVSGWGGPDAGYGVGAIESRQPGNNSGSGDGQRHLCGRRRCIADRHCRLDQNYQLAGSTIYKEELMAEFLMYPGSIPLDTDVLETNRNGMIALRDLARMILGTNTIVDGLACAPTAPASMAITVGPAALRSCRL